MFCRKCGVINPEDSRFCESCGTPFSSSRRGSNSSGSTPAGTIVGTVLGNYRLDRYIGAGGMGVVYQALDLKNHSQVAVKVLGSTLAHDRQLMARFEQEAEVQASLRHKHVVEVYDFIVQGEYHAIVMEYVDGLSLEDLIHQETGAMMVNRIKAVMIPVLQAISLAHSRGIVHRDIKPANILIGNARGAFAPKVLDFGIAKVMGGGKAKTQTTSKLGTEKYMSPEHFNAPKSLDHRADIYSLGITLFEMATGKVPFNSDNKYEIMRMHIEDQPPPPHCIYPGVNEEMEAVILKALQKRPEDRFSSAAQMLSALKKVPNQQRILPGMTDSFAGVKKSPEAEPEPSGQPSSPEVKQPEPTGDQGRKLPDLFQGGKPQDWQPGVPELAPVDESSTGDSAQGESSHSSEQEQVSVPLKTHNTAIALAAAGGLTVFVLCLFLIFGIKGGKEVSAPDASIPSTPDAAPPKPDTRTLLPLPSTMVAVAGGQYAIGCQPGDTNCFDDEKPRNVKVGPFGIMRHEVTAEQYDICVGDGACPEAGKGGQCNWQRSDRDNHPINCVSWKGARAYCKYRGWTLPTEWQWEVAARGADLPAYPWGGATPTCDRTVMAKSSSALGCGSGHTWPVGSKPLDKSWCGALDMGGNIREWVLKERHDSTRASFAVGIDSLCNAPVLE